MQSPPDETRAAALAGMRAALAAWGQDSQRTYYQRKMIRENQVDEEQRGAERLGQARAFARGSAVDHARRRAANEQGAADERRRRALTEDERRAASEQVAADERRWRAAEKQRRYRGRVKENQAAAERELGPLELRTDDDWAEFYRREREDRAAAGWADGERRWPGDGGADPRGGHGRGDGDDGDLGEW
jgi:hypothetical protein